MHIYEFTLFAIFIVVLILKDLKSPSWVFLTRIEGPQIVASDISNQNKQEHPV